VETTRIADLLQPFLNDPIRSGYCHPDPSPSQSDPPSDSEPPFCDSEPLLCHSERSEESAVLTHTQLQNISTYIDLLLRWNARINLTAIRQPEEIVTRHFGESLFAARHLFPSGITWERTPPSVRSSEARLQAEPASVPTHLIDIGSGAGFPGLPIKVWATHINVTLIESNQKKATFLREVIRALTLTNINVFPGRAEAYSNPLAETVTLRAVEHFDQTLPIATRLVTPGGRLALLISEPQLAHTHDLDFTWSNPLNIPLSSNRRLLIGQKNLQAHES
jgi:16S rRNA (guanine527-N7)-methyltransferase